VVPAASGSTLSALGLIHLAVPSSPTVARGDATEVEKLGERPLVVPAHTQITLIAAPCTTAASRADRGASCTVEPSSHACHADCAPVRLCGLPFLIIVIISIALIPT